MCDSRDGARSTGNTYAKLKMLLVERKRNLSLVYGNFSEGELLALEMHIAGWVKEGLGSDFILNIINHYVFTTSHCGSNAEDPFLSTSNMMYFCSNFSCIQNIAFSCITWVNIILKCSLSKTSPTCLNLSFSSKTRTFARTFFCVRL